MSSNSDENAYNSNDTNKCFCKQSREVRQYLKELKDDFVQKILMIAKELAKNDGLEYISEIHIRKAYELLMHSNYTKKSYQNISTIGSTFVGLSFTILYNMVFDNKPNPIAIIILAVSATFGGSMVTFGFRMNQVSKETNHKNNHFKNTEDKNGYLKLNNELKKVLRHLASDYIQQIISIAEIIAKNDGLTGISIIHINKAQERLMPGDYRNNLHQIISAIGGIITGISFPAFFIEVFENKPNPITILTLSIMTIVGAVMIALGFRKTK